MVAQHAAADRRVPERREEQEPARRAHGLVVDRAPGARIEATVEAAVQLGGVRVEAVARAGAGGVRGRDLHLRGREEALDLAHRGDEPRPPVVAQRREHVGGQLVAAPVEQLALGAARGGEAHGAHAPVARRGLDRDEPGVAEAAQQAAEVARVQPQPRAQRAHVGAAVADLPQDPRLAERPVAREVAVVERADALGHRPVEPADLGDLVHSLTLVRDRPHFNGSWPQFMSEYRQRDVSVSDFSGGPCFVWRLM